MQWTSAKGAGFSSSRSWLPLSIDAGRVNVEVERADLVGPLLERIEKGEIDPTFVITHRMKLEEAPVGYETFMHKEEECMKIVLKT